MNEQEREEFNQMKNRLEEMTAIFEATFNSDGTLKQSPLVIEADGNGSTAGGSVRMQTNLGPKDFLVV